MFESFNLKTCFVKKLMVNNIRIIKKDQFFSCVLLFTSLYLMKLIMY